MFHIKNHKQLHIFDPFAHIGFKRRKISDKSWSGGYSAGKSFRNCLWQLAQILLWLR